MSNKSRIRRSHRDEQIERQGKNVFKWIVGALILLTIILIIVFVKSAS